MFRTPLSILIAAALMCSCKRNSASTASLIFDTTPVSVNLPTVLFEVSGIASSPKGIWLQMDGGNPAEIYLTDEQGVLQKKVHIQGVQNRDWEDMALSSGSIYLAETGDNNQNYSQCSMIIFPEPTGDTVKNAQVVNFQYENGPRDVEGFVVDPSSRDIYLLTKKDAQAGIYRLAFPYSGTARFLGSMKFGGVTSAAISPDGSEILVRTYGRLAYFKREGRDLETTLKGDFTDLIVKGELQGEAVSFKHDGKGFYTAPESPFMAVVPLSYYKRR